MMTRRRCSPPDLHYLENGFILTEQEAKERLTTTMVVNRRKKKVVRKPEPLSEEDFVEQLRQQTRSVLLEVCESLKLLTGIFRT